VASWSAVLRNRPIRGEKALRVPWRREALHPALPLAGGLLGVLRAVVQIPVLPMFHAWEELPLGSAITRQLVRANRPWPIGQALEPLAEKPLRRRLVPPALHQDIEDLTLLIDGPPEIVPLPVTREKDLLQRPCVPGLRPPMAELIRIRLPKLAAPFAHGFVGHRDPACKQQFFHIAIAEAEPEIAPDRVADELDRETVRLRAIDGWCVHAPSMAHQASARQAAQQVDIDGPAEEVKEPWSTAGRGAEAVISPASW
jgi:hypothetical protein